MTAAERHPSLRGGACTDLLPEVADKYFQSNDTTERFQCLTARMICMGCPVQLACLMDAIEHLARARAPLGRLAGLVVPVAVSGGVFSRLLPNVLERAERRHHHSSAHGNDDQESAYEHPAFYVEPEARCRHADGRNDQDECHESTNGQGPEDGRFHDVPYIIVGNIHENGDLLPGSADA